MGSIGAIYVPAGITNSYCIHAEFLFHISDTTKKVYFRGYETNDEYPTLGHYILYVDDANLTYEFIGE